jgi:hypothetical protein
LNGNRNICCIPLPSKTAAKLNKADQKKHADVDVIVSGRLLSKIAWLATRRHVQKATEEKQAHGEEMLNLMKPRSESPFKFEPHPNLKLAMQLYNFRCYGMYVVLDFTCLLTVEKKT